ncbi:MAG: class I SAM-dependent rRNA methyltransferase [Candidatus Eisenbacteria bacterium]|nr:class I SAM-dependent rRNA methyltransferase [Candidatus Eisenbacteria bacterium]
MTNTIQESPGAGPRPPRVRLKGREDKRLRGGHLWVFSNEIRDVEAHVEPGDVVHVVDGFGRLVGTGYINPHSLIAVRLVSRSSVEITEDFLTRRIANAHAHRERALPDGTRACRVVYGEADLLPGLVVDRYGDCVAVQSLTAGIERRLDLVLAAVQRVLEPKTIVLRNDSPMREYEGLDVEKRVAVGELAGPVEIEQDGHVFLVDVLGGQKTGFYLDQRENRRETSALGKDRDVLDCCCYTGAWSVYAAAAGATSVTLVDSSGPALELARSNWERNGLATPNELVDADAFKTLAELGRAGRRFGLVILDPPSLARGRKHVREALKAHRTLNRLAIAVTRPGGHLVTSKCSHLIESEAFMNSLVGAAREAGRHARVIAVRGQSLDHPVILGLPETGYLQCVVLEVI